MRLTTAFCVAICVGVVAGSRKKDKERVKQTSEKVLDDAALTLARGDELLASYLEGLRNKDSNRMKKTLDQMKTFNIRGNITKNSELLEEALMKEEYKGYSKSSFARSLKLQLDILGVKYDEILGRDGSGNNTKTHLNAGPGGSSSHSRDEQSGSNSDASSTDEDDDELSRGGHDNADESEEDSSSSSAFAS